MLVVLLAVTVSATVAMGQVHWDGGAGTDKWSDVTGDTDGYGNWDGLVPPTTRQWLYLDKPGGLTTYCDVDTSTWPLTGKNRPGVFIKNDNTLILPTGGVLAFGEQTAVEMRYGGAVFKMQGGTLDLYDGEGHIIAGNTSGNPLGKIELSDGIWVDGWVRDPLEFWVRGTGMASGVTGGGQPSFDMEGFSRMSKPPTPGAAFPNTFKWSFEDGEGIVAMNLTGAQNQAGADQAIRVGAQYNHQVGITHPSDYPGSYYPVIVEGVESYLTDAGGGARLEWDLFTVPAGEPEQDFLFFPNKVVANGHGFMRATYTGVALTLIPEEKSVWEGGSHDWNTNHWTVGGTPNQLPSTGVMTVDVAGNVVTVNGNRTAAVLEIGNSTVTVNSALTASNAVLVGDDGTLNVNGTLNTGYLSLTGDVNFAAGSTASPGAVTIDSGGTLTTAEALTTDSLIVNSGGTFTQTGSAAAGKRNIAVTSALTLDGQTVDLTGGATLTAGAGALVTIKNGTTLTLDSAQAPQTVNTLTVIHDSTLTGNSISATSRYNFDNNVVVDGDLALTGAEVYIGEANTGDTTVTLSGTNEYTGKTFIRRGVLEAVDGVGLPNASRVDFGSRGSEQLAILQSSGLFARNVGTGGGQVWWSQRGGFAAKDDILTVTLNGGAELTWGSHFRNTDLQFGSESADNVVVMTNDVNVGDRTPNFQLFDNPNVDTDRVKWMGNFRNANQIQFNRTGTLEIATGYTWSQSGSNHAHDVNVNNTATLVLNGTLQIRDDMTVAGGATLAGDGTIDTATNASSDFSVIQIYGTVAPGNSSGTLTIDGDLQLAANATYECEVDDLIAVTGDLDIPDASVTLALMDSAFRKGGRMPIFTYGMFDDDPANFVLDATALVDSGLLNQTEADALFLTDAANEILLNGLSGAAPALPGDANDNGFVDDDDLAVLLSNWEADVETITTWELGDFTNDTDVDDDDLAVLLGNWTGPAPGGAAVPEPVSAVLLMIGAPLAALRRRRK